MRMGIRFLAELKRRVKHGLLLAIERPESTAKAAGSRFVNGGHDQRQMVLEDIPLEA